jgi:hypothetical protein
MDLDSIGGADADRGRDLPTASLLLAFYNQPPFAILPFGRQPNASANRVEHASG